MMSLIQKLVFFFVLLSGQALMAEGISGGWSRADTIPFGRSFFQMQSTYQNFDTQYDSQGGEQPLSANFGQRVKKSEMNKMADTFGRTYLKNDDLERVYDINTTRVTVAPRWSYGFRDWWMFSFRLPVHVEETEIKSTIVRRNERSGALNRVKNNEEAFFADQAADEALVANGYDGLNNFNRQTFIGDVTLSNQFRWLKTEKWIVAFRQDIYIPAGPSSNPYNYFSQNNDEGQLDIGGALLVDFFPLASLSFTTEAYYIAQTPDRQQLRVPQGTGRRIDAVIDESVDRDLGNKAGVEMSLNYKLSRALFINTGYEFNSKGEDNYSGSVYSKSSYSELAKNTDYRVHLWNLGITLGRLDRMFTSVRGSQFFAHLKHSRIIAAQNVAAASRWHFSLGLSF